MRFMLSAICIFSWAAHATYEVCTATINSSEEWQTFKRHLPAPDFHFTELTELSDEKTGPDGWFNKACANRITCDVVIISGHFGGDFFGKSKLGLELADLDQNSCDDSCPGILNHPKEVYLFGCNTLAGKNTDRRSQAQVLANLIHDGQDYAQAERNLANSYSRFGSTFKQRMEAIFAGVPRIYGFSAVAPSGASVKRSLEHYLARIGDFKAHLDSLSAESDAANWLNSMREFNRTFTRGAALTDPVRVNSCELIDSRNSLAERVALALRLLATDSELYLPAVSRFLNRDFAPINDPRLGELRARDDLRKIFYDALDEQGVGDSILVDLDKAARAIGWMSEGEFEQKLRELLAKYVNRPGVVTADFVCSQLKENPKFAELINFSDLQKYDFRDAGEFKIAGCLKLDDPVLGDRALAAFYSGRVKFRAGELEMARGWLETLPNYDAERARQVHAVNERRARILRHRFPKRRRTLRRRT